MNTAQLVSLFLLGACVTTHSQVLLNTGDSFTFEFTSLPFDQILSPFRRAGGGVSLNTVGLEPGEYFRLELFDHGVDEEPKVTRTFTNHADGGGLWQDLQGTVRVTMLNGSMTLNSIMFSVTTYGDRPDPNGPYINNRYYQATFIAVPEPSTVSFLGLIALGGASCRFFRLTKSGSLFPS